MLKVVLCLYMIVAQFLIIVSIFNGAVNSLQASDFDVYDLPLVPKSLSSIRMHAGYLPVDSQHHGALFFCHFAKKSSVEKSRTVIWLAGGPGGSSLSEAWMGIGPFRFQDKDTIVENSESWHLLANLLFVDQPVGTGFSYTDTNSFIHELEEMTNQFLHFLDRYIEIFPKLLEDDIYLAGSSFAGQYIPYIAQAVLEKTSKMKLRGLLIGNGWIDPVAIYMSYLPFAVENSLVMNDSNLYHRINDQVNLCQQALFNQVHVLEEVCDSILDQILQYGAMNNRHGRNEKDRCVNVYDIRFDDVYPRCGTNNPVDLNYVTSYLNRADVMSSLHADGKVKWTDFSYSVYTSFDVCHSTPSIQLLPDLLRRIPILLYNGEFDLISNHRATEKMIDTMPWNNKTGFDLGNGTLALTESWMVEGQSAGLIRTVGNLVYILFFNTGHLVTYYQTRRSRVMLQQFIELFSISPLHDQITTTKKSEGTNQTQHRVSNGVAYVAPAIIITVIGFVSLVLFVLCKWQQPRISTLFKIMRVFRLKTRDPEQQQRVMYSALNNSSEDLHNANPV